MQRVYLSLGSNTGEREQFLQQAIRHLHAPDLRITRLSSVYETSPQDRPQQPWFLNMVVESETTLFPMRLLLRIANIERRMGRKRLQEKGPRSIDIDILLYGSFLVNTPQLQIPHPAMSKRRFVLEPLAELAPDLRHPESRKTIRELLAQTASQACRKVDFRPSLPMG